MRTVLVIDPDPARRLTVVNHLRCKDRVVNEFLTVNDAARVSCEHVTVVLIGADTERASRLIMIEARRRWPHAVTLAFVSDARATHEAHDVISIPSGLSKLINAIQSAGEIRNRAETATESLDVRVRDVYAKADRAALVTSTVLITGETGTGKEELARHIHRQSDRHRAKFVPVNCGGIPESLIETELYGYKRGAFTGAAVDTKGLVEEAEGGILFLDEIGEMPPPMQVRLLRFLDRGEIRPVGGATTKHVDVRVVAATNRALQEDVHDKRFREDLYFRLSVVLLHLPPLRERRVDIPELALQLLRHAGRRLGLPVPTLTEEAIDALLRHDWPGNIRELQNALEFALIQCSGPAITAKELPASVLLARSDRGHQLEFTDRYSDLLATLERYKGSHKRAAAALRISRTTLWRRLKHLRAVGPTRSSIDLARDAPTPPSEA